MGEDCDTRLDEGVFGDCNDISGRDGNVGEVFDVFDDLHIQLWKYGNLRKYCVIYLDGVSGVFCM